MTSHVSRGERVLALPSIQETSKNRRFLMRQRVVLRLASFNLPQFLEKNISEVGGARTEVIRLPGNLLTPVRDPHLRRKKFIPKY